MRTAGKQLGEGRLQAQKMETIGKLTSGIAHELNNPLGAILGFAQILLQQPDAPDQIDMLRTVEHEARRCSTLVREMLTFIRKPAAVMAPESLRELVEGTLNLIGPVAKISRVTIVRHLELNVPLVFVNGNQMQQVIINLFTNALDVMPHGGVLSVTINQSDSHVILSVSDTGEGMSREQLKRIYEPFFTTKVAGKGTGLGLSLVKDIVRNHNGHVEVESEVGRGTTFRVFLRQEGPANEIQHPGH